jgi:hypothetical protein
MQFKKGSQHVYIQMWAAEILRVSGRWCGFSVTAEGPTLQVARCAR